MDLDLPSPDAATAQAEPPVNDVAQIFTSCTREFTNYYDLNRQCIYYVLYYVYMRVHFLYMSINDAQFRWFPPSSPLLDQRWDADAFVHGLNERGAWLALGDLKTRIREGARLTASDAHRLGVYRPSSIRGLALDDSDLAPMPASWGDMATVGPGDVVVSKFLPVDAAWVAPVTSRRPVDANCARVIGLQDEVGFWVANVLEHPAYQGSLARRVAGATLPRIGLRDLRTLRVPSPPIGLKALVLDWSHASRSRAGVRLDMRRLRAEVNDRVDEDGPSPPNQRAPRFHAPAELGDSWLPVHAALQRFQADADLRGWKPLRELISPESERLRGRRLAALRVLRLSGTNGLFGFELPGLAELRHPSFRIYGHPLEPNEVLLSVLGSSPKVVLNHPDNGSTVWLSDHWARFRGLASPGALALLLDTPAVTWQLTLATTGAARQFVAKADIAKIRIPWPEPSVARNWHERLATALENTVEADAKLNFIRTKVMGLVDVCLGGNR